MRTSRTSRGFQQIWKEVLGPSGGTASNIRDQGGFCLHAIFDTFHCIMPESSIRQKNKNLTEINEKHVFPCSESNQHKCEVSYENPINPAITEHSMTPRAFTIMINLTYLDGPLD